MKVKPRVPTLANACRRHKPKEILSLTFKMTLETLSCASEKEKHSHCRSLQTLEERPGNGNLSMSIQAWTIALCNSPKLTLDSTVSGSSKPILVTVPSPSQDRVQGLIIKLRLRNSNSEVTLRKSLHVSVSSSTWISAKIALLRSIAMAT